MEPLDNSRAVAQELVSLAREQGIDLGSLRQDDVFIKDRRWVWFWRKESLSETGPANEPQGTLHYNLQGAISALPGKLKESASAFQEVWSEAGTFDNLEEAFELVRAWLLDWKEVDDLPARSVRRFGI